MLFNYYSKEKIRYDKVKLVHIDSTTCSNGFDWSPKRGGKGGGMYKVGRVLTRTVAPQENMLVVVGGEGEEH